MDNQQKNDFNEMNQQNNKDDKFSKNDLEFLKQIGALAREFQTEYNSLKEQGQESTYQRTK